MAEPARSLKVFVSYSRTDVDFADQLVLALEDKGFETILDRHDLSGGENWRERLGKLILSADAVAFVLTAKSAASEICSWEVEEAKRLGKRILPVTPASPAGATPPAALGELNWIPFYADPAIPGSGFYYGVKRLMEALSIDLEWLRDQTRYSERAAEWARARADDLLLRGAALKDAEDWLARTPAGSAPPASVREYLTASSDAEQARQVAAKAQLEEREQALKLAEAAISDKQQAQKHVRQISMWALIAGVALLAIAIPGNYFATTRTLDANDRRAAIFADAANEMTRKGDYAKALLLALAGDPAARTGFLESVLRPNGNMTARSALARAYAGDNLLFTADVGSNTMAMVGLVDGKRFVTFHADKKARIWELGKDAPVVLDLPAGVSDAVAIPETDLEEDEAKAIRAHGDLVLLMWTDASRPPSLWSLAANKEVQALKFTGAEPQRATAIGAGVFGNAVIVGYDYGHVAIWAIGTEKALLEYDVKDGAGITAVALTDEYDLLFAAADEEGFVTTAESDENEAGKIVIEAEDTSRHLVDIEGVNALSALEDNVFISGTATGQIAVHDSYNDGHIPRLPVFVSELGQDPVGIRALTITPKTQLVLLLSTDGQAKIVRGQSGVAMDPLSGRRDIDFIATVHAVDAIATASQWGQVHVWALAKAEARQKPPSGFWSGLAGNSGALLDTEKGSVRVSAVGAAAPLREIPLANLSASAISPDGQTIAAASDSGLCLFNVNNKDECRLLEPKPEGTSVVTILFSPDSRAFLALTRNGEGAKAWSVETGQPIADLSTLKPVTGAPDKEKMFPQAVSPGGQHILYRSADKVEIVRTSDGVSTPLPVDGFVYAAAFSPDGEHFALGVEKGGLQLWRIGGERPEHIFQGHEHEVGTIVFDGTGELLLTGAEGGDAKLWRLDERDYLQRFELTEEAVVSVAFEADNRHVLLLSDDGVSRWAVSPIVVAEKDEQLKLACERLESRGVVGFTPRDRLDYPFLKGVDDNPCVSLGLAKQKPPAPSKPVSAAPAAGVAP